VESDHVLYMADEDGHLGHDRTGHDPDNRVTDTKSL
jgi:hypothetical protein